ncbi:MAG: hypothetical protein ACOYOB_13050 [Myxococcota bacterium]
MTGRLLLAAVLLVCALPARMAWADDVLENAPVVRRQLEYRANRHEITALFGATVGDPYKRNLLPGVRYNLHLYDWLAVGADLMVGIPISTGMADEIGQKMVKTNENFVMEATSLRFLSSAAVSVTPLQGKFMAFGSLPMQFDFHLDLSCGIAGIAGTPNIPDSFSVAPGVGGGVRVFVSRVLAITGGLSNVFIDRTLAVNRNNKAADGQFGSNLMMSAGVSFFMPPELGRSE